METKSFNQMQSYKCFLFCRELRLISNSSCIAIISQLFKKTRHWSPNNTWVSSSSSSSGPVVSTASTIDVSSSLGGLGFGFSLFGVVRGVKEIGAVMLCCEAKDWFSLVMLRSSTRLSSGTSMSRTSPVSSKSSRPSDASTCSSSLQEYSGL